MGFDTAKFAREIEEVCVKYGVRSHFIFCKLSNEDINFSFRRLNHYELLGILVQLKIIVTGWLAKTEGTLTATPNDDGRPN